MLLDLMRPLSSQVRYAICGIFDLAYNADMKPVQLRVIGACFSPSRETPVL